MAIPELSQDDIKQALQYIDLNGVPPGYKSKTYDLIVEGKSYPPKYVIAMARSLKDGSEINVSDFNAVEAKNFFITRGYKILTKQQDLVVDRTFWVAGTTFNGKNQIDLLVKDHYWEGGECDTLKNIKKVKVDDIIIANTSSTKGSDHKIPFIKIYAVGLVKSQMVNTNERPEWYRCDVDWVRISPEIDFDGSEYGKYRKTMQECSDKLLRLKNFALEKLGMPLIPENIDEDCSEYVKLLQENHNIILHGAPGTGKTFLAKKIAEAMGCCESETGFVQFHQSYDYTDFVEGLRPAKNPEGKVSGFELTKGVFKKFCEQAEKNWSDSKKTSNELQREKNVDERIETFLNEAIDSKKEFEIVTGNKFYIENVTENSIEIVVPANERSNELSLKISELKQLLLSDKDIVKGKDVREFFSRKRRLQHDSYIFALYQQLLGLDDKKNQDEKIKVDLKNYVFIIDEINRGEMSKIFGELFFSIDPGYRGEKGRIKTQYQNLVNEEDVFAKGFFVPENVYIIGTMNDIDRSVESMDFAMRRRFAFKEIKAEDRIEMLDSLKCGKKTEAAKCMQALNKEIENISGLSSAYHIGPAYFLKLDNYEGNFEDLWKYHIEGVLCEYLRGMPKATDLLTKLKVEYDKSFASGSSVSTDDASGSAENP